MTRLVLGSLRIFDLLETFYFIAVGIHIKQCFHDVIEMALHVLARWHCKSK
jgi:hypothetical protein